MSPALRVLAPGLMSTIQDLGRPGHQQLGVPVGGALDPLALRAANALVGNAPEAGAIEVAYVGPMLAVEADDVRLAFAGVAAAIELLPDATAIKGERIEIMRSVHLHRGQVVRIGSLSGGAVLYVAAEGGFDIEPVLGSVSTYVRGGFGGWHGRALAAGDRIPLHRRRASDRGEYRIDGLSLVPPGRFRAMVGPQADHFADREIAAFFETEYRVGAGSDRMGMRLAGRPLVHARGFNITSDAIAAGSVQVPGDGQPIVLLADRQTTGGYPKIATVVSADLPALGRLPIGATIAFEAVSRETALELRRALLSEINGLEDRLVRLVPEAGALAPRLFDQNLISGVVDARGWSL